MARIRTIKPEFFTDEDIGELPPLHRLLFIALWGQADKRGRLADKPVSLKVKCLPYDDCDIEQMLVDLAGRRFIHRYEVQGARIIEIPKFLEHQRPHPKEPDMGFPDPPEPTKATPKPSLETLDREKTRQEILNQNPSRRDPLGREGKGREGVSLREGNGGASAPAPESAPPLIEQLAEAFTQERGASYGQSQADDLAMRSLLQISSGSGEEILRRWRIALRRTRYPTCSTLRELAKPEVWNASASGPPGAASTPKSDPNRVIGVDFNPFKANAS